MSEPVKKGKRPDGSTFYYFRVSAGRNAAGKRIQVYRSGSTRKEVLAEYARVLLEIRQQRFVAPKSITVNAYLDAWERAHGRDLEAGSRAQIRHALQHVRVRLGDRKLQSITRSDVDNLVDWMLTSGRKRGGIPGTGLGPRTVQLMLIHFQRACEDAVDERLMPTNPCRRVKRPKQERPEHDLWSDEEMARFDTAAAADRLHPVIMLQCLGLRPEEVCGLKWSAVDLTNRVLHVRVSRTLVNGQVVEKPPKTAAGRRILPLDDTLTAILKAFKARQAAERMAAGEAYAVDGYVLCDELGGPYDPARLRRVWYRLMRQAGVRKVTPYTATRHAAGSYLAHAGVSPDVIAAWLGHTDAAFTMRTYIHARPEDLVTARDVLAARSG
jgi:integrase